MRGPKKRAAKNQRVAVSEGKAFLHAEKIQPGNRQHRTRPMLGADPLAQKNAGQRHENQIQAGQKRSLAHRRVLQSVLLERRRDEHDTARRRADAEAPHRRLPTSNAARKQPKSCQSNHPEEKPRRAVSEGAEPFHADGLRDKRRPPNERRHQQAAVSPPAQKAKPPNQHNNINKKD